MLRGQDPTAVLSLRVLDDGADSSSRSSPSICPFWLLDGIAATMIARAVDDEVGPSPKAGLGLPALGGTAGRSG